MKDFNQISTEIFEAAKQYEEIDPQMANIFMDSMEVYIGVIKALYSGDVDENLTSQDLALDIFEKVFNIDISDVLVEKIKVSFLNGEFEENSDEAIENADEELLKSIRENINQYIKA